MSTRGRITQARLGNFKRPREIFKHFRPDRIVKRLIDAAPMLSHSDMPKVAISFGQRYVMRVQHPPDGIKRNVGHRFLGDF